MMRLKHGVIKINLIAALLISSPSFAAPISMVLSWAIPTTRPSCVPLPLNEIRGYRIYIANMFNGKVLQVGIGHNTQTTYTATIDDATWYLFYIRTVDMKGVLSDPSQVLEYDGTSTTAALAPKPTNC